MESNPESAAVPAEAAAAPLSQEYRFEFHGNGGEYFRIWIVNLLLTLATLGIYGAWAKVRRLRYFYGNTVLAGSSFEYHGEPLKILKGRLIAVALLIPYLVTSRIYPILSLAFALVFLLLLPFIVVKSRRFLMRMSSWRNVRFDFAGEYRGAVRAYIGVPMLASLTLGVLYPYSIYRKQAFVIGETKFGTSCFEFNAKVKPCYIAYALGWLFLLIFAAIAFAAFHFTQRLDVIHVSETNETFAYIGTSLASYPLVLALKAAAGLVCALSGLAALVIPLAIIKARTQNEAFGKARLLRTELHCALSPWRLAWLYFVNGLWLALTLGLYGPWAKVRLMRYQFENMSVTTTGDLDEFVAAESEAIGATGEEVGDLLDVDFGL